MPPKGEASELLLETGMVVLGAVYRVDTLGCNFQVTNHCFVPQYHILFHNTLLECFLDAWL